HPHTNTLSLHDALPISAETKRGRRAKGWLGSSVLGIPTPAKLISVAYGVADQALAVGAGFLVNVALARTQTKEEYGMFALSYSRSEEHTSELQSLAYLV